MLERFEDPDGFVGYRSPVLTEVGVPHLFTTRRGGVAGELDLAAARPAQLARVVRASRASPEARLVGVRQVHGADALEIDDEAGELARQADALVTERRDRLVAIHVADCVPILLARSDGRRVAAVHAGWRGLVAGVVARALAALGEGEHVAAVGPCLSLARFEVGEEVAERFAALGLSAAIAPRAGARPHVDLRGAARLLLERGGVARIDLTDRCTFDHAEEFYSHRRDVTRGGRPRTGRLAALIAPA